MTTIHVRARRGAGADRLLALLGSREPLGVFVELDAGDARISRWHLAGEDDELVVDAGAWPLSAGPVAAVLAERARTKVVLDATSLSRRLFAAGVRLAGVFDVRAVAELLLQGLTLSERASAGIGGLGLEELSVLLRPPSGTDAQGPARRLLGVAEVLSAEAERAGLGRTARLESAVACVLGRMEHTGVPVDATVWRRIVADGFDAATRAERSVAEAFGVGQDEEGNYVGFNIDSPSQLSSRLSAVVGRDLVSTRDDVLAGCAHPVAAALRDYRAATMLTRVATAPVDGALRPRWHHIGTVTGRITSTGPNVQGLPRPLREAIAPPEGMVLGAFDYGRQEPYVLAALSHDAALLAALGSGDPYDAVAEAAGVGRDVAKRALLACAYGMSAPRLAATLGLDLASGRRLYARLHRAYPRAMRLGDSVQLTTPPDAGFGLLAGASRLGEVRSLHRRRLVAHSTRQLSLANTPVQATGADMVKEALVGIDAACSHQVPTARIVAAVHDEILLVAPQERAEELDALVRSEMTAAARRCLGGGEPPPVTGGFARNWLVASK